MPELEEIKMTRYFVLLRSINVGGRNRVAMAALRAQLEAAGFGDVQTYIQSGNIALSSPEQDKQIIAGRVRSVLLKSFEIATEVWVRSAQELESVMQNNPFPEAVSEPKTLHVFFLLSDLQPENAQALQAALADSEQLQTRDSIAYLHAPKGIGRSKLVGRFDQLAGTASTARNWQTITRLQALA